MAYDDGYGQPQQQMGFAFPPFEGWVKRLVILNAAVFLAVFLLGWISPAAEAFVYEWLALSPAQWLSFPVPTQLVTYGFLHSMRDLGHLVMNMLGLWMFGSMVLETIGGRRFISHYLIALAVSGLGHLVHAYALGHRAPAIGASGAVFMVVVAAAVMRPHARVILIIFPIKLWVLAAGIVALGAFSLLTELKTGATDGVAHSVHLAGAAYGYFAAKRRWLWKDPLAGFERKRAVAKAQRQISDDARMDAILQKINREGIGSLTRGEKAFLQKQTDRRKSG